MAKNEKMVLQGFGETGRRSIDQDQPYSDLTTNKHYGMPITPGIFWKMVDRFRTSPSGGTEEFKNLWWVEFSKASLLRVLSQEGCEYFYFFYVVPEEKEKEASLAVMGADKNHRPIKRDLLLEVAKQMTAHAQQKTPENQIEETIMANLADRTAALEEARKERVSADYNNEEFMKIFRKHTEGLEGFRSRI